ncbi:MAG: hypothetical protein JRH16_05560 [Deltaproteobacteria bacterium]|nr:hypothetical protein [Deltaproteobacteria bacterium]MBW2359561.1 hypothetical protein [Deltaproteobacteria bacterium]
MQDDALTPFEVFCHSCKVTFALGTKRCVHCGGRLLRRGGGGPAMGLSHPAAPPEATDAPEAVIVEEQASGRLRLPFSPMTLLWLVLIAGTVAQRACGGG